MITSSILDLSARSLENARREVCLYVFIRMNARAYIQVFALRFGEKTRAFHRSIISCRACCIDVMFPPISLFDNMTY